jgi:hypothetical protein
MGVIHSILSNPKFFTGLKNLDGAVVMKIIGNIVFLKLPFFKYATSVSLGIVLPSHLSLRKEPTKSYTSALST